MNGAGCGAGGHEGPEARSERGPAGWVHGASATQHERRGQDWYQQDHRHEERGHPEFGLRRHRAYCTLDVHEGQWDGASGVSARLLAGGRGRRQRRGDGKHHGIAPVLTPCLGTRGLPATDPSGYAKSLLRNASDRPHGFAVEGGLHRAVQQGIAGGAHPVDDPGRRVRPGWRRF